MRARSVLSRTFNASSSRGRIGPPFIGNERGMKGIGGEKKRKGECVLSLQTLRHQSAIFTLTYLRLKMGQDYLPLLAFQLLPVQCCLPS